MATHKKYTEEDKAVALANLVVNNGNVQKTAKFMGIPETTLRKWKGGAGVNEDVAKKCDEKKEDLADLFEQVVRDALGQLPFTLESASYAQLITGAGIATDKMQLLRNKPTVITDDLSSVTDDELDRRIAALERGEIQAADKPAGQTDLDTASRPADTGDGVLG